VELFKNQKGKVDKHQLGDTLTQQAKLMRLNRSNIVHFIHYGIVGASLNLFGFLIYLVMTWLGMEQKLTVTVFYPLGIL